MAVLDYKRNFRHFVNIKQILCVCVFTVYSFNFFLTPKTSSETQDRLSSTRAFTEGTVPYRALYPKQVTQRANARQHKNISPRKNEHTTDQRNKNLYTRRVDQARRQSDQYTRRNRSKDKNACTVFIYLNKIRPKRQNQTLGCIILRTKQVSYGLRLPL